MALFLSNDDLSVTSWLPSSPPPRASLKVDKPLPRKVDLHCGFQPAHGTSTEMSWKNGSIGSDNRINQKKICASMLPRYYQGGFFNLSQFSGLKTLQMFRYSTNYILGPRLLVAILLLSWFPFPLLDPAPDQSASRKAAATSASSKLKTTQGEGTQVVFFVLFRLEQSPK